MATGTGNKNTAPHNPESTGDKSKDKDNMTGQSTGNRAGTSGMYNSTQSNQTPANRSTGAQGNQGAMSRSGMTGSDMNTEPPEQVAQAIDDVSDKAKEVVDRASEGLKQTSASAAVSLQQAQQAMVDRAYDVKSQAAQQLQQAAQSLRHEVRSQTGQPVQQAEALAKSLDNLGNYLEQRSFEDIENDLRHTIQRNPWQSVGVAVAIGWVLSRLFGPRR